MNEIAAARIELGITLRELADSIGVNRTTVMRWEKGERNAPEPARRLIRQMLENHRAGRPPIASVADGAAA